MVTGIIELYRNIVIIYIQMFFQNNQRYKDHLDLNNQYVSVDDF